MSHDAHPFVLRMEETIVQAVKNLRYTHVRKEQMKAIISFVNGKDVFVSLPMGFGKSFCYSVLPVLFNLIRGHSGPTCLIVSSFGTYAKPSECDGKPRDNSTSLMSFNKSRASS